MYTIKEGLSFDDVLIEPKYSSIKSRSDIDVSVKMNNFIFKTPIIPANMKDICGKEMALAIINSRGLAILHRFIPIEEQLEIAKSLLSLSFIQAANYFAMSIGIKDSDRENVDMFYNLGIRILCIDIAHGDSESCVNMIKWIKEKYSDIFLIAGNVATGQAATRLWLAGADAVKVGIGPGAVLPETGNGVPQLTALMDVAETKARLTFHGSSNRITRNLHIIADGGTKNSGDCVKSLLFADMVMAGNIFAGCEEAPSDIITDSDGNIYKSYNGSSTHKDKNVEGVKTITKLKGPYKMILDKLLDGIRSGCAYQGVNNLIDLKKDFALIKVSNSGIRESNHHDVNVIKE